MGNQDSPYSSVENIEGRGGIVGEGHLEVEHKVVEGLQFLPACLRLTVRPVLHLDDMGFVQSFVKIDVSTGSVGF